MVTGRESGEFSRRLFIHGLFFSSFLFSRHFYIASWEHGRNASWVMDIGKAYIAITLSARARYRVLFNIINRTLPCFGASTFGKYEEKSAIMCELLNYLGGIETSTTN